MIIHNLVVGDDVTVRVDEATNTIFTILREALADSLPETQLLHDTTFNNITFETLRDAKIITLQLDGWGYLFGVRRYFRWRSNQLLRNDVVQELCYRIRSRIAAKAPDFYITRRDVSQPLDHRKLESCFLDHGLGSQLRQWHREWLEQRPEFGAIGFEQFTAIVLAELAPLGDIGTVLIDGKRYRCLTPPFKRHLLRHTKQLGKKMSLHHSLGSHGRVGLFQKYFRHTFLKTEEPRPSRRRPKPG